jgi:S1-C subfamily serine protease
MSKKKKKSPKSLNLFGIELDYSDYVKRFLPENKMYCEKIYGKYGVDWKYKATAEQKSKYWDCRKIYPTTDTAFKKKFFQNRKLEPLEGIWSNQVFHKYIGELGYITIGIVKNGPVYDGYYIDYDLEIKTTTGSVFKDIFNHPGKINYKILNGTKFGIYIPQKNNKKVFKLKGLDTIMDANEALPANYLTEYNHTLDSYNLCLTIEWEVAKIMEEKTGQPRVWNKEWPLRKMSPKKHTDRKKKNVDKEKKVSSVGTGFFVSDKGHIVTNAHVVKDSSNIKFMYKDEEIEAKLIASDNQLDLALLKAKIKNKYHIKFSNKSPQKAQNILVAGYPFGKALSDDLKITGGIINSLKGIRNNTSMLQVDATMLPGNSGGPIVDKASGSLVAVSVQSLSKEFTKQHFGVASENTNYGIKSSQVRDFLEANNLKVSMNKSKFKLSELENSTVFIVIR